MMNRSAPTATIVPILIYEDVGAALAWLCGAFGFVERLRVPGPGGAITHAQLTVREGAIMLGRRGGPFGSPRDSVNQYVHVSVEDVDRHFEHAKQFGAKILSAPSTQPFGERQYTAEDPSGHWWTFSQHVADVAPADWGAIEAPKNSART